MQMKPLRIALALPDPPLPLGTAAGRVFYALLRGLAERGHRVAAFVAYAKPEEMLATLRLFPAPLYDIRCYPRPHRAGIQAKLRTIRRPFSYTFSDEFRDDLCRRLDTFDIVHLEDLFGGWLGIGHPEQCLLSILYLPSVDFRGTLPLTPRQILERLLMKRAEKLLLRSFRFFRTVTPELAGPVRQANFAADIIPIPISLDLGWYPYVADDNRPRDRTISLIGSMGWRPSYSAAVRLLTRLYPRIKRHLPDARFRIVGWAARKTLGKYLHLPDVEILENVPDARPFFERATVLLYAPEQGSGAKVKVFEAMALGVPVVTTSSGVEGLPVVDGVEAKVADDDEGLVERTVALLCDRPLQNRQRRAARDMLDANCNPALTAESLEQVYARMLQPRKENVGGDQQQRGPAFEMVDYHR